MSNPIGSVRAEILRCRSERVETCWAYSVGSLCSALMSPFLLKRADLKLAIGACELQHPHLCVKDYFICESG